MNFLSLKNLRLSVIVITLLFAVLLAYEVFFLVVNSNRNEVFPDSDMPPQENSSGLFSSYIGENSDYLEMKAKSAIMIDFDRDNDLDLYYGFSKSYFFENEDGFFTEMTNIYNIENSGSTGLVSGDIDNNGYPDILKWRFTPSTSTSLEDSYNTEFDNSPHQIIMNHGNHI